MSTAGHGKLPQNGPASGLPASGIPASGIPARGTGTRPPLPLGHTLSMSHGARSPRVFGDLARRLAAGLTEDRPDLDRYPEAVAAWATAEAQTALIRRHLAEVGPLDDEGEPRGGLLGWLTRLESAAARHRAVLGLDPRSEAALSRERAAASVLAVDLEAIAETGRRAIARREAAGLPSTPDLVGDVLARTQRAGLEAWAAAHREYAAVAATAKEDDDDGEG